MTDQEKQCFNELQAKTAYLLTRQREQNAQMNRLITRLIYLEARQHRLMRALGLKPQTVDTPQTALDDARTINLAHAAGQRAN